MDGDYSFSLENGNITMNQPSLNMAMKVGQSMTPGVNLSGIGSAIASGVDAGVEGIKGVAKGVPIGLSNFAKEFNKTFLPGYEENVVPFLNENVPGLKSLNQFTQDIFEYKNKAQEIGGSFIGEPLGEFGVSGGAISGVAKTAGIGNRFLANVLGYGTAEVIAVPVEEQGLLSMGIEYLSPDSPITTAILESLKSDEDQSVFIQKLQKAPENFFVGGVVGEQLDKAVRGVGTLYKYIKNSPKLDSIKQELKGGISNLGDIARNFLEENRGGTTLGSTDIPKMVAEGTKALDEMVNKPQGPELTGSSGELGFYSKALEETKKLQQKKGTGQQFRQMLKKAGVSDDEIEWSGLNVVLSKDKTTKKEIEDQLRLNKLEIREVVKDKLPEEVEMDFANSEMAVNDDNRILYANEGTLAERLENNELKSTLTPEDAYGSDYINERADELFEEFSEGGKFPVDKTATPKMRENAFNQALTEYYDDPIRIYEDENTGIVITGNDNIGYSIFPDMESTKGEGAFKNAYTYSPPQNRSQSQEIYSLPEAKVQARQIAEDEGLIGFGDEGMVRFSDDSYRLAGGENYREFVITSDRYDSFNAGPFRSDHFDERNIIGHFRTSDRTTLAGDKVLYIDEIQSDWGQTGREKGFRKDIDDPNDSGQIVRGPFVENTPKWTDLMVKRILAKAVEEGYDMVSFSPGYIQNMRWRKPGLIKYYDDILVKRVTKIVDKLDDTAFGAGNEQLGQLNKNRGSKGFGRINLDDTDFDEIEERALDQFKADGAKVFDFEENQVLKPFTVRMTNKLKEGVKKGQSLFALPVVAGATAMTMEDDDG